MPPRRQLASEFSRRLTSVFRAWLLCSGEPYPQARKLHLEKTMRSRGHRILVFLLCAVVLLGAGFAAGYANAYGRFYSPEALLDRELVHMDFNSRLLHYTLLGQQVDCRRELVRRLQGEVTFVGGQLGDPLAPDLRADVEASMERARTVMDGHPLTQAQPSPAAQERD